ncbi:Sensor protein FixL [Fundidesulfovibrio magnetotacticus]|uniref:histidine kinase n=1 Tax=Fundidesulfovibrio magnetotacticus TaxID=2730080 RepID=A0A6V8LQS5_9BACT|nr:PAS domain-containing sensor histidine kinase [Fundidesulfovibrio magnetotacticus]GFK93340.1 Sensor protein FixL [Fundidesulfovibrio magnetotacticus]
MSPGKRDGGDITSRLRGELDALARRERHCQMLRRLLEELREEYRSLALSAPDAIVACDAKGQVVFYNHAAQALFGREPEEVMGTSLESLLPERMRERHGQGFGRAARAGRTLKPRVAVECVGLHADGSEFPVEITHSSWKRGQATYFAAFIRDISERKHYERLREDVERIVRHDLKSPLLGIVGFARLLMEDDSLTAKHREWARLIHDSGQQMDRLLANSQAMLRMRQGDYSVTPRPVDLTRLLEELGKRFEPVLRERGVGLACETSQGAEGEGACSIQGEEAFLDDMLSNLIKNAVEASPEGASVSVTLRREGGHAVVDIHNLGVIPPGVRERFFEPYVTGGKPGGTGLGAHSALLIARAHDGEIDFTSDEEEGTHVLVRLPVGGSGEASGEGPEESGGELSGH